MSDSEKLIAIADWFRDNGEPWQSRWSEDHEVEDDLRRIAKILDEREMNQ